MCQIFFEILIPSTKSLNCSSKLHFMDEKLIFPLNFLNFAAFLVNIRRTGTKYCQYWAVLVLVSYCTEFFFFGTGTGTDTDW